MANRFVKTGGSNLLDGTTTGNAWETAIYGFTNVGASNTLKFLTGTYDIARSSVYTPIPNGSSGSPTIITDNGDGAVTFNHNGSDSFFGLLYFTGRSPTAQYISFIGTAAKQLIFDLEDQAKGACIYVGNEPATDVSFVNCEVRNAQGAGILGGSSTNLLVDNCDIHDNGQVQTQDHGIYASGTGLIIKNSRIYNNIAWGVHCYDENKVGRQIYNNRIWGNGGDGILMSRGSGTIYNNVIFDNAQHGVSLWRTVDATVYHNSIYSNTWWGISDGTDGRIATRSLIKNNISIGNTLGDCKTFSTSANAVISWNIFGTASITSLSASDTVSDNAFSKTAANTWVDPTNATPSLKDFNLKALSPAIWDATTNNAESVGVGTDIAGTSRVHPDQGAYAYGTPDPPDPPVIGHLTNYPVTVWTLENIALTLFDNDGNTKDLTLDGSTDGVSIEFGDNTNCTVT